MPQNNNDKHEHTSIVECDCCSSNLFEEKEKHESKLKPICIIGISAVFLIIGMYLHFFKGNVLYAEISFLLVAVISGHEIVFNGIKSIYKGKFSISFLTTIAAAGAFLLGQGFEGASVLFLFFIAEYLEDYAGERSKKSIAALVNLTPQTAYVKRDGKNIKLHSHAVNVGETVIVRPGDKIPLDGIVTKGNSSVNQAAITGESIPVSKKEGSDVFAGTINEEGYLEVKVTKRSGETVLSKIIELVKDSQKNKSRTEAFIERFANYYTPAVIGLAILIATVPTLIFGLNWSTWIYRALVLLVVSCPCALAISTPVAMVSGITAAANNGVIIKGGVYVELMKNIKTIVFDKTGTLTEGRLEITDTYSLNNYSKDEIFQIAGSLESKSKHPLAEAITRHIEKLNISLVDVHDFESIGGKGVKGMISGKTFYVGKKSLFRSNHEFPDELMNQLENQGKTTVLVGNDHHIIGLIGLKDKTRPLSRSAVQKLKRMNIRTLMLTGDNEGTAETVSSEIGVDNFYSGLLPEDKVRIIEELLENGEHVAMVGDGVNDAPALARSDVGIVMGSAGSDVAIETADIALMNDDISKIYYLISLSKKTMAVVKENVTVSILVKGSFAIFAVMGFVSLWMAVAFGDMGLTLLVIVNALRIGRVDT